MANFVNTLLQAFFGAGEGRTRRFQPRIALERDGLGERVPEIKPGTDMTGGCLTSKQYNYLLLKKLRVNDVSEGARRRASQPKVVGRRCPHRAGGVWQSRNAEEFKSTWPDTGFTHGTV
jgi:hypothetical protein